MNKIKKYFIFIALNLILIVPAIAGTPNLKNAFETSGSGNNDPLDKAASTAGYNTNQTDIDSIIGKIISTIISLLGIIFLALLIYGGFTWMKARGNEQHIEKAQGIIRAAIIGLILTLSAYAISYFVLSSLATQTLKP